MKLEKEIIDKASSSFSSDNLFGSFVLGGINLETLEIEKSEHIIKKHDFQIFNIIPRMTKEAMPSFLSSYEPFCFPEGPKILWNIRNLRDGFKEYEAMTNTKAKIKKLAQLANINHYVLTDEKYFKRYCSSIVIYDEAEYLPPNREEGEVFYEGGTQENQRNSRSTEKAGHRKETIFLPISLSVISYLPVFEAQKEFLLFIFRIIASKVYSSKENLVQIPLENFDFEITQKKTTESLQILETKLIEFYLSAGLSLLPMIKESYSYSLFPLTGGNQPIVQFKFYYEPGLNFSILDFSYLYKIKIVNILKIFMFLLLEKEIIFISETPSTISVTVECFMEILSPLKWQCIYIPFLPQCLYDYLNAGMPSIFGIEKEFFEKIIDEIETQNKIIFDLDEDKFVEQEPSISLPIDMHNYLCSLLNTILANNKFHNGENMDESVLKTKQAFYNFFLMLFHKFFDFFRPSNKQEFIGREPIQTFDKSKFVASFETKDRAFINEFMETMLFSEFLQEMGKNMARLSDNTNQLMVTFVKDLNHLYSLVNTKARVTRGWRKRNFLLDSIHEKESEQNSRIDSLLKNPDMKVYQKSLADYVPLYYSQMKLLKNIEKYPSMNSYEHFGIQLTFPRLSEKSRETKESHTTNSCKVKRGFFPTIKEQYILNLETLRENEDLVKETWKSCVIPYKEIKNEQEINYPKIMHLNLKSLMVTKDNYPEDLDSKRTEDLISLSHKVNLEKEEEYSSLREEDLLKLPDSEFPKRKSKKIFGSFKKYDELPITNKDSKAVKNKASELLFTGNELQSTSKLRKIKPKKKTFDMFGSGGKYSFQDDITCKKIKERYIMKKNILTDKKNRDSYSFVHELSNNDFDSLEDSKYNGNAGNTRDLRIIGGLQGNYEFIHSEPNITQRGNNPLESASNGYVALVSDERGVNPRSVFKKNLTGDELKKGILDIQIPKGDCEKSFALSFSELEQTSILGNLPKKLDLPHTKNRKDGSNFWMLNVGEKHAMRYAGQRDGDRQSNIFFTEESDDKFEFSKLEEALVSQIKTESYASSVEKATKNLHTAPVREDPRACNSKKLVEVTEPDEGELKHKLPLFKLAKKELILGDDDNEMKSHSEFDNSFDLIEERKSYRKNMNQIYVISVKRNFFFD